MDIESAVDRATKGQTLLHNNDFFKLYYKKTEKIVCAVLYILTTIEKNSETDLLIKDIEKTSQSLIDAGIHALAIPEHQALRTIDTLAQQLLGFETKLRMLAAAQLLDRELLFTILAETDLVLRYLSDYRQRTVPALVLERQDRMPHAIQKVSPARRRGRGVSMGGVVTESHAPFTGSGNPEITDRKQAIATFLRGKDAVSIKDISAVMTDCSEKTIQRSLNDLIKDGAVLRSGDRRWSKYSAI